MSQPENHKQFQTEQRGSDARWVSTVALIVAVLGYIWIASAIVEKLAPVAGGQ